LTVFLTIVFALAPAIDNAQDNQRSANAFRASVDLIVVNVVALDKRGQPVEDLGPRDFSVKIDGRQRDVVSAELVKAARGVPAGSPSAATTETLVSTNALPAGGRLVAVAVDQTLITPGSIKPLLNTASQFIGKLTTDDRVALVTFPEPGPHVDFTTDKARVRQALELVVGQPQKIDDRSLDITLSEAVDVNNQDLSVAMDVNSPPAQSLQRMGPAMRTILQQGCRGNSFDDVIMNQDLFRGCVNDVRTQAVQLIAESRTQSTFSLRQLESFLRGLIHVEGSKSLVLISAGLALEDSQKLDEVVRLAAASRTSVNVVWADPEMMREANDQVGDRRRTAVRDRSLELQPLQQIADRTGGSFLRALGSGAGIFDQLTSELSAWYVVAVERRSGDPERQRVEIDVRRRGVTTRANRTFVTAASLDAGRPREELLSEALASPLALTEVPLRVSTFTRRDAASGKYQVRLSARIGQPGAPAADFTVGHMVKDAQDRVVASQGRQLPLSPAEPAGERLPFDAEITLGPGTYSLRVGVVDATGRRGTVVRPLELAPFSRERLTTSDLVVGSVPIDGESLRPDVEPHIGANRVAALLELYLSDTDRGGVSATLEIAEGDSTPALTTAALNIASGEQPDWRIASGTVAADLLPGRYIARVTVRNGTQTMAVVARPFVFDQTTRPPSPADRATANRAPAASAMPRDLQLRTATYIGNVVASLSNVVAQEDFVLERPDRKVTSDFLLVRYPGSERDFLTYRDVTLVNGKPLPGREQRLVDLFLKPLAGIRERAREITTASQDHVPPSLNPIFVLAFLQTDYQRRFELTTADAGPEWPAGVVSVAFVETARPTLLRGGPFGDFDIPTRGTAWIEARTGRILQTELEMGTGKSRPRMVTRFALDPRLQIVVPQQMRTENPTGVATYSNFRRFNVETDTTIANQR
jgi:VWFA-related protein